MKLDHGAMRWGGTHRSVLGEGRGVRPDEWLHPAELECFASLRDRSRREGWLGGRWCVKRLVIGLVESGALGEVGPIGSWREVAIFSRDGNGRGMRPEVYVKGKSQSLSVSIAHSDRQVYAAIDVRPAARVGVDVVDGYGRWDALASTWFTRDERRWLCETDDRLAIHRIWSAKEACYKAISPTRSFDPRSIAVERISDIEGRVRYGDEGTVVPVCWEKTRLGLMAIAVDYERVAIETGRGR